MDDRGAPFGDVPANARGHLGLLFYEAVLGIIAHAVGRAEAAERSAQDVFDDHPFLGAYFAELSSRLPDELSWDETFAWLRSARAAWEADAGPALPLRALRDELGVEEPQVAALLLVGVVEEDARFGDLFAALQPPHAPRRPTLAGIHEIVGCAWPEWVGEPWTLCRPLVDAGLLEALNADAPRSEWVFRVPSLLWAAIRGEHSREPLPGVRHHPPESFPAPGELLLDDRDARRLTEMRALAAAGEARALVVRGLPGSERLEIIGALARALARGVLEVTPAAAHTGTHRLLGPLATLVRAVPAWSLELGPGEVFEVPECQGYRGACGVVLGHDGGLAGTIAEGALSIHLSPETVELRSRHWHRALPAAADDACEGFARSFTLGGGYIRRAARLATGYAALERRESVSLADIREAARAIGRQQLDSLATRLEDGGGWGRLVVHPATAAELHHLEQRCRHRERLTETLSGDFPGGLNRGVRALFQGPSGTGKTLAARVLASELGLDLYRVDLASIVNKYIGETEKNLSRILARAEDLDIVLLLDEGDSLMGKRTEVKSANDRWANLETNYLLQRLDTYTGIVLVTTNAAGSIDTAFQRRMDVVVSFHLPEIEERWELWQLHLPPDHAVPAAALEDVARRFALTGGQIRNVAVQSVLHALAAPGRRVREADLAVALEAEYRKAGASFPRQRDVPGGERDEAMSAFLGAIS
jgi:hypothetical protein